MNKVILVGNCTNDGEMRYSQGGMGIYKNSLAINRKFTVSGEKKEETTYIDFTAFARSSEICNQYLRKGSKILVEGRLNFNQWVDQNGQKRSKHSVIVETMQMLDSKGDNQHQPQQHSRYNEPQQAQSMDYNERPIPTSYETVPSNQARQMPSKDSVPEIDINEDEIPF